MWVMNSHECPAPNVAKRCTKCGIEKPVSGFYKSKKRKDGSQLYFSACIECVKRADKQRYERSKEAIRERQRAYVASNADKIKAYMNGYYLRNREQIIRRSKEYQSQPERKLADKIRQAKRYEAMREEIRAKQNERRQSPEEKEKARKLYKRHYEQNKLRYVIKGSERRATRVMATPKWYRRGDAAPFYELARKLTEETGIRHVVDHIIPLKGETVCGLHVKENLQVIPEAENLRKHNRYEG